MKPSLPRPSVMLWGAFRQPVNLFRGSAHWGAHSQEVAGNLWGLPRAARSKQAHGHRVVRPLWKVANNLRRGRVPRAACNEKPLSPLRGSIRGRRMVPCPGFSIAWGGPSGGVGRSRRQRLKIVLTAMTTSFLQVADYFIILPGKKSGFAIVDQRTRGCERITTTFYKHVSEPPSQRC